MEGPSSGLMVVAAARGEGVATEAVEPGDRVARTAERRPAAGGVAVAACGPADTDGESASVLSAAAMPTA